MLHMEYVSLWNRGLDVDSSREVKNGSIRNVVLPKNDEDKMDRPCKQRGSAKKSGRKEESPKNLNQNLVGHILRHDGLMKNIVEGQVLGKEGKGPE